MLDFTGMLNEFKRTDVDPRELILMFKNLLLHNVAALSKHFTQQDIPFDLHKIIEDYKLENGKSEIKTEKKIQEAKKVVA